MNTAFADPAVQQSWDEIMESPKEGTPGDDHRGARAYALGLERHHLPVNWIRGWDRAAQDDRS